MSVKVKGLNEFIAKLNELGQGLTKDEATQAGQATMSAMKDMISQGQSPITGRNFPRYKNPQKYPGRLKSATPVNLHLSGDFLDGMRAKVVKTALGFGFEITYLKKELKKEEGHRVGWNGQPKRPTIPEGNEKFATRVREAYTKVILDALKKFYS